MWDICWLHKTFNWSVKSSSHMLCFCSLLSTKHCSWVHPSRGKRDGIWRELNCDCVENEGEKIRGLDFCRCSHGRHRLGQWRNLVSGILEEKCHNQFRAICADIKEVNSTNLKGLAKQEDESSPYPVYNPDLTPSEFHLSDPLKDGFEVAVLQTTMRWITECHIGLQLITRVLFGWYSVSYAKVEKVCC